MTHTLTVDTGSKLTINARSASERNDIIDKIKAICSRHGLEGDRVEFTQTNSSIW